MKQSEIVAKLEELEQRVHELEEERRLRDVMTSLRSVRTQLLFPKAFEIRNDPKQLRPNGKKMPRALALQIAAGQLNIPLDKVQAELERLEVHQKTWERQSSVSSSPVDKVGTNKRG